MTSIPDITADAVALQERDEFREAGWLKLIAPAKVNLHLAIGARRADGYHEAVSVMHAINLHDVVYARRAANGISSVRMVACGDVELPVIEPEDNIALRALRALEAQLALGAGASMGGACGATCMSGAGVDAGAGGPGGAGVGANAGGAGAGGACGAGGLPGIELRIEKHIPVEGGLGGGSTDAAAALVAAAALAGLGADDPAITRAARSIGADVAFFLHGGCALLDGAGDRFVRALEPMKRAVALVKPPCGVSTAAAYRAFDEQPSHVPPEIALNAAGARDAADVALFNNLAPASERLAGELAEVRTWLGAQPGVEGVLLCGSGATTFAVCSDFASACKVVSDARRRGWWSRATSFGSARTMAVSSDVRPCASTGAGAGSDAAGTTGAGSAANGVVASGGGGGR